MALVTLPRQLVVDSNGTPRVGAKLYVYDAGTTTPHDSYTTPALDIPHSNPILSLSAGLFPAVYVDPEDGDYKLVCKDSADITLWTEDNISPTPMTRAEIGLALFPITNSEQVTGFPPVNYAYPPGDEARQAPDSSGLADSEAAILASDSVYWANYFSVPGTYSHDPLTLSNSLTGLGWTSTVSDIPALTLRKRSNGTQLALGGGDSFISRINLDGSNGSGKTGDGLQVAGTRQTVDSVSVHSQGSDGLRIGGAGASGVFNANLWVAIRPIALSNTSDGCYIHHSGGTTTGEYPNGIPDCNAGLMLSGDFRLNGATGLTIQNSIDNVFVGLTSTLNTGKGVVLKPDAKGHKFFGLYSEGNNGSGGNRGDEVDIESGAVENLIMGLRSNQTAGAGLRDVNTAGKNLLVHYDAGVGSWVYRAKFALWNPLEDGSTTADFECWVGTVPVNAYNIKGSIGGTTGGVWTLQTKIDGGALTDRVTIAANGDATWKNQANGNLFGGKTAFDTTTTGTNISGTAGRIDIVNSGAGAKTCMSFYDASGAAGNIATNGSGTTAYNTTSDVSLKSNIDDSGSALAAVASIRVRSFNWKSDGSFQRFGFVAQELNEVAPEAVTVGDLWAVDPSKLVPMLVKAVQELTERVRVLEARA